MIIKNRVYMNDELEIKDKKQASSPVETIVIGQAEMGQVEWLIGIILMEVEITTGAYFNMYFAKSRKAWVVQFGQSPRDKVERGNLHDALDDALGEIINNRVAKNGHEFTLYD
jgi:hypothetical protein